MKLKSGRSIAYHLLLAFNLAELKQIKKELKQEVRDRDALANGM